MNDTPVRRQPDLSDIVPIVLHEVTRLRAKGELSPQAFADKIARLAREELDPRGLSLLESELPEGGTRFIIKTSKGALFEMIDCIAVGDYAEEEVLADEFGSPAPVVS